MRFVPLRLNEEERQRFELAKRKGFAVLAGTIVVLALASVGLCDFFRAEWRPANHYPVLRRRLVRSPSFAPDGLEL